VEEDEWLPSLAKEPREAEPHCLVGIHGIRDVERSVSGCISSIHVLFLRRGEAPQPARARAGGASRTAKRGLDASRPRQNFGKKCEGACGGEATEARLVQAFLVLPGLDSNQQPSG
jgi:hypothetical protein